MAETLNFLTQCIWLAVAFWPLSCDSVLKYLKLYRCLYKVIFHREVSEYSCACFVWKVLKWDFLTRWRSCAWRSRRESPAFLLMRSLPISTVTMETYKVTRRGPGGLHIFSSMKNDCSTLISPLRYMWPSKRSEIVVSPLDWGYVM